MELSYFIAHARYAYSLEDLTTRNIAQYAPKFLYGAIYIPEEDRVLSFNLRNAESFCEYLKNASHIIGFRGNVFGIPTLKRYYGLKGRIPRKGKHTDVYSKLVKLNGGQTVSLEKAFYSNSLTDKYERVYSLSKLSEQELEQYSTSSARNIYKLFELYNSGELRLINVHPKNSKINRVRNISTLEKDAILTIELVPRTAWLANVRSEISKAEWDMIRRKAYQGSNYKCSICGGVGKDHPVECHEIWHYDDDEHKQTLVGFTALCPSCHGVKHIGFSNTQGRGNLAQQHLSKVNGWSKNETARYIKAQFDKWQERNCYEWDIDLSLLDRLGIKYE